MRKAEREKHHKDLMDKQKTLAISEGREFIKKELPEEEDHFQEVTIELEKTMEFTSEEEDNDVSSPRAGSQFNLHVSAKGSQHNVSDHNSIASYGKEKAFAA